MNQSQQIAAEHPYRAGSEHGKQDHLTGHESSRQALEHSNPAYQLAEKEHEENRTAHAAREVTHETTEQEIAALAYRLWEARHCPAGSPEEDWFRAVEELRPRY